MRVGQNGTVSWVSGASGWFALLVGAVTACTFYTERPAEEQCTPTTGGATSQGGSGGSSASGGSSGKGGGGDAGQTNEGGSAGDGGEDVGEWVDATGDLTGRTTGGGNVVFLSAKPDEDRLIVGVLGSGLSASTDGGETWDGLGQSGTSDPIINVVIAVVYDPEDPDVFWESGLYYGGGVYRTDDGGTTIRQLGTLSHAELVSVDFTDPDRQTLIAGGHEAAQTLYRSTDGGENWDLMNGATIPEECRFSSFPLVIDASTYLVGCVNMIVRTEDAGESWEIVSMSGGNLTPLRASDGAIYWVGDTGLVRSDDDGATWERVLGAGVLRGTVIELPDERLASYDEFGVLVSSDRGRSWIPAGPDFPYQPKGLVYSAQQKAFFIWTDSQEEQIPERSIMRADWDFEIE